MLIPVVTIIRIFKLVFFVLVSSFVLANPKICCQSLLLLILIKKCPCEQSKRPCKRTRRKCKSYLTTENKSRLVSGANNENQRICHFIIIFYLLVIVASTISNLRPWFVFSRDKFAVLLFDITPLQFDFFINNEIILGSDECI